MPKNCNHIGCTDSCVEYRSDIEFEPHDVCKCGEIHDWEAECKYVSCDDENCRALRDPITLDDYKASAIHWQTHRFLSGCSHGK